MQHKHRLMNACTCVYKYLKNCMQLMVCYKLVGVRDIGKAYRSLRVHYARTQTLISAQIFVYSSDWSEKFF